MNAQKLKQQSRVKWRKIAEDLRLPNPQLAPSLGRDDCGYCEIYSRWDCSGCALYSRELCRNGSGDAYEAVRRLYVLNQNCWLEDALAGAEAILKAIEQDIAADERKEASA